MLLNCTKLTNIRLLGKYALFRNLNVGTSKSFSISTKTLAIRARSNGIIPYKLSNGIGRGANYWLEIRLASSKAGDKLVKRKSDIQRLFALAKPEKWVLLASVGCLFVSSAITMTVPFAVGRVLDIIFTETFSKENLTNFCLILSGVFLIGGLANFGRIYLMNTASMRIIRDLRSKLYRTMLNQDAGWYDTKGSGELINRLSNDTTVIANSLSQNLSDGLRSSITVVAGFSMMFYTSPELSLFSMAVVPVITGLAITYGRYVKKITKQMLDKFADIMRIAEERLNNVKTVKLFCKENKEDQLFRSELDKALHLGYKDILARASFYGMTGVTGNFIIISVLYFGGTLVSDHMLTVGALTSFLFYAAYLGLAMSGISNFYTELNKGIGAACRMWEIIDRKYAIPIDGGLTPLTRPKGQLEFKNVSFSFPTRPTAPVLRDLNVKFNAGELTAIVGRSGSGKTTMGTLLLRLYDPQCGSIHLDGTDLKDLNPTWLRQNIGAVNQEPALFSGTIRENILYGLKDGEEHLATQHFDKVVKQAYVDDFVNSLPDGYETLVGQRGMMLSGGQKQRVAIARALIRDPPILILDEATSALDSVSEALIQKSLENVSKGRTVLTIAHRLSTIRNASKIVVIDNSTVVEQGSYDELIANTDGIFRKLVEQQTFTSASDLV